MSEPKIETLWPHLHWLTVLAQQGSYVKAAQRLGVSKSSMSQRIAELERAAGVSLVQRTTRSIRFTPAGQTLVEALGRPFEQLSQAFASVRDTGGPPRGLVRVTAPVAFARQQLVPRLSGFLQALPEVRIELDMSDRLRSLAVEGFDLAIRHAAALPETHVAWRLCPTHAVLVASRAYLERRGTPAAPPDLAHHACLHYLRSQALPTWHFKSAVADDPTPDAIAEPMSVRVSGPLAANNSEALRDAAVAGLGIALMPDFSAQSALQAGQLVEVLPRWRAVDAFADQLFAVRPYAVHIPRAVSAFVEWLRMEFVGGFST